MRNYISPENQSELRELLLNSKEVIVHMDPDEQMHFSSLDDEDIKEEELSNLDYSKYSYRELGCLCEKINEIVQTARSMEPDPEASIEHYRSWAEQMNRLESFLADVMYLRDEKKWRQS